MEIFKLVGSIYVDNTKANDSISKTSKEAEGLGGKLKSGVETAAKWGVGIVTAAAAVGTAMFKSAQSTAENLDVIDKASQRMKIGAESYQELAHAAGLCGVEMSTMEQAAKKLEGTDLSLDDALDQIYSLETAEERAAMAAELFGDKVAYEMTPMLNASGEEMESMRQEAHDLGIVMSEETVKAGAEMNDTFSKVTESFGAVVNQIGTAVMPIVNELLTWLIEHMPEIKEIVSKVVDAISTVVQDLMVVIQTVYPIIEEIWKNYVKPFIEKAYETIKEIIEHLYPVFETLCTTIKTIWDNVIKPLLELVISVVDDVWTNFIKPILFSVIDFIGEIFSGDIKGAFDSILEIISTLWEGLKELLMKPLNWVIEQLGEWWEKATEPFQNLVDKIGEIWETVKSAIKLPHVTISGSFSLKPLKTPSFSVEWYKNGGIMNDPTAFGINPDNGNVMVGGEAGAEAIAPLADLENYYKKWSSEANNEYLERIERLLNDRSYLEDIIANALKKSDMIIELDSREFGRMVKQYG